MSKAVAFATAIAALVYSGFTSSALAADYPTKPITLMIGFAPGGPSDVMARILTRKMEEILKQPFVIENRAGAGGGIAGTAVARAAPDGYTVLLATGSLLAINVSLYKNLGYDPEKDFEPISVIGTQTNVLYTHPSVPAKSLCRTDRARQGQSGQAEFGSGGNGTPAHLAGELLKIEAKLDMTHVPFRGTGPALQAVIGGHVPMAYNPPIAAHPSHPERRDPPDRDHDAQANGSPAGGADHRRVRLSRLRGDDLACAGGAGGDAEGRDRRAASSNRRDRERSGRAQGVDRSRRRCRRRHAGGASRLYQVRNSEMGAGGEGLRRQGRLNGAVLNADLG